MNKTGIVHLIRNSLDYASWKDHRKILDTRGFTAAPRIGSAGEYVFERAFVDK